MEYLLFYGYKEKTGVFNLDILKTVSYISGRLSQGLINGEHVILDLLLILHFLCNSSSVVGRPLICLLTSKENRAHVLRCQ
jgi:hypothetical protein